MDETLHLYEGERLLCVMRAGKALLVRMWLRALLEAVAVGAVLSVIVGGLWWWMFASLVPPWIIVLLFVVLLATLCIARFKKWRHASFRVTTDRILIELPVGLFRHEVTTIKWQQYQESYAGQRGPLDLLFRTRPLTIRFGNADATRHATYPSLRMASDLKHFLDKVDSAVRRGAAAELRPFVEKRRGERD